MDMNKGMLLAALVFSLLAVAACAGAADESCPEGFETHLDYRMYFGLTDSAGNTVSEAEWSAFLADTITPRFPNGLTVLDGRGQWLDPSGNLQREPVKVLIGVSGATQDEGLRLLDEISEEFETRFNQDSVFRVIPAGKVCAGLS
jgi:hypothetical protein